VTAPSIGSVRDYEIDALVALMHATIAALSYYNESAIRAELAKYTADEVRSRIAGDPSAALVARDGDGLVGYCVSRWDNGTIYLDWYGTDPRARGRGIGAALLDALTGATEADGIWTIQTAIFPENTASLRLHQQAGFRVVGTRQRIGCHHGRWRDVTLLERRSSIAGT